MARGDPDTRRRTWLRCAALFVLVLLPSPIRAQLLPTGFTVQMVVGEPFASLPVGFAFLPDGRPVVIEKNTGNVRVAAVGSTASSIIGTITGLTTSGERGLLGVAVDPAWPARPYLYFHSTHNDSTIHLTMVPVSGALADPASTALALGSPYLLLRFLDQYEHHNGGTVRFGPDGLLYASLGDDGWVCRVHDVDLLNGKILRLDVSKMPGSGSGPPPVEDITPATNPFFGASPLSRLVFARGLRNPFRFTIDPQSNDLVIGDVGALDWEEVDLLEHEGYTGSNFGWPEIEGFMPTGCCPECTFEPPYVDPIYVYPNPSDPISASVIAGPLYRRVLGSPRSFGAAYDGNIFLADMPVRWIRRLVRTGSGWEIAPPVPGQPNALDWATNVGGIVDLQQGSDGALYFIPWPGGALARGLWRIIPTVAVDAPDAAASAAFDLHLHPNPAGVRTGVTIALPPGDRSAASVYDVAGRLVRVLAPRVPGTGTIHWDGRATHGGIAAPGTYYVRIESRSGAVQQGRITWLR